MTLNSQNYDYIGSTSNTNSQCWLEFWVAEDKEESLTLQKKGPDILAAVRFWYQGQKMSKVLPFSLFPLLIGAQEVFKNSSLLMKSKSVKKNKRHRRTHFCNVKQTNNSKQVKAVSFRQATASWQPGMGMRWCNAKRKHHKKSFDFKVPRKR